MNSVTKGLEELSECLHFDDVTVESVLFIVSTTVRLSLDSCHNLAQSMLVLVVTSRSHFAGFSLFPQDLAPCFSK